MRNRAIRYVGAVGVLTALTFVMLGRSPHPAAAASFTAVATGDQHTCAILSGNGVQCWGRNVEGEVGDGTTTDRLRPVTVPYLSYGASAIDVGGAHSCAVLAVWTSIKCWGKNQYGQIGDGTAGTNRLTATTVCASGSGGSCVALTGITAVAAGDAHTCALSSGNSVKCWGDNYNGQLGNGTTTNSNNPVDVSGLTGSASAIALGQDFSCALTTSGGVKCWGDNFYGQLGDGTTTMRLTPVDVSGLASGVSGISAGANHACAVLTTGGLKCWGFNYDGELGDGTSVLRLTPVSVCLAGAGPGCTTLTDALKVAAGGAHTCAIRVIIGHNDLWCWGSEAFGQLGNSVQTFDFSVANPIEWTRPSWGNPNVTAVSAGAAHTCALISASVVTAVECWGWNSNGQLANGTTTDTTTWVTQDADSDGCTDGKELGPNHALGGQRDPQNFWDFFDTPDDANTTLIYQVTQTATPPFTITVGGSSTFPAGPDTFYIDNEQFSYSSKTSTTFYVTARAQGGTVAAQHNGGALVVRNVRDKVIASADQNRTVTRNNATGSTTIDPLSPPAPAPAYHTAFDRTLLGPNNWNLGPPNGQINITDINYFNYQMGDSCQ